MIYAVNKFNVNVTKHDLTPAEFFDKMYRRELPFLPDDLIVVIFK